MESKGKQKILEEKRKQIELKRKYNLAPDEKVVIKETSNMAKWSINLAINIFKALISVIIVLLTSIGIITLCYEKVREPFFNVLKEAIKLLG